MPESEAVTLHAGLPAKNMTTDEFRNRLAKGLQSLSEATAAESVRRVQQAMAAANPLSLSKEDIL